MFAALIPARAETERQPERKNPARGPGLSISHGEDVRELPGWLAGFRSARTRRHAGSHAGAGDDLRLEDDTEHRVSLEETGSIAVDVSGKCGAMQYAH